MNAAELLLGAEALARHGGRTARICENRSVSYAELAERVARSAGALRARGVGAGDRVLLLMPDGDDMAAAWLATVRVGAVAVGVNPKLGEAELAHVAADCKPRLALAAERVDTLPPEQVRVHDFRAEAEQAAIAAAAQLPAEAPAFMLYSSGTTGRPKGIVHSHRGIAAVGLAFRCLDIRPGERVFTTSKHFFAYGLEHGLLAPLATGATSIVFPGWPDAECVVDIVSRHRPAAMFSVPTIYRRLLAAPGAAIATLAGVRRFVSAGERLSKQLAAQWHSAVGAELLNLYGMSETFCAVMMTPPGTSDGLRTGLPFEGVQVELREPGELWVKHPAQAKAYANLPRETRAQFRDGWFCSRDLFSRDAEGHYIHQGRSDELIKIAGQWVHPGELEELAALEAAVAEAACVPVADADGLERLALFVTATGDPEAAQCAARDACERLPRHKRPKWIRAVDELPRTATGKVQRFKLREILTRELGPRD